MKVIGCSVAYLMVPVLAFDDTTEGHVIVDLAIVLDEIDDDPKNGSLITSN